MKTLRSILISHFISTISCTKVSFPPNYQITFNPNTNIRHTISLNIKSERSNVVLKVYYVLGKEVATLVNEEKSAGIYEIEFNPSSINHIPSSEVYLYQLMAGDDVQKKKMILLK
jgi:hypothetical protein